MTRNLYKIRIADESNIYSLEFQMKTLCYFGVPQMACFVDLFVQGRVVWDQSRRHPHIVTATDFAFYYSCTSFQSIKEPWTKNIKAVKPIYGRPIGHWGLRKKHSITIWNNSSLVPGQTLVRSAPRRSRADPRDAWGMHQGTLVFDAF